MERAGDILKSSGRKPDDLTPISDILPAIVKPETKPLTPIQERLVSMPVGEEDVSILYQHSVLCQTCMPYRDPGEEPRLAAYEWLYFAPNSGRERL
jgi:hypothetical protein